MNLIKNVTFGLIGGTYGVTGLGVIDGGQLLAIVSVALGGGAMVAAFIVKNHLQKKKLNTQLTIEMY
ncbi:MAG TPA: hypothetical protein VEW92_02495 [Nitrososphaeraceae archaeon]|jgi:hypothetical protein|nr:hypothetical protein [Nitrososphaeraceae archaeon]